MALIPSIREEVATFLPNKLGADRLPQAGKLIEDEARATAALRVNVAMEKAVTVIGPLRIAIDQAIIMVATDKREGLYRESQK